MKFLEAVGASVFVVPLVIATLVVNGFVLSALWAWFAVPTFGLPVLHVAPAIGVALVVGYLTHQSIDAEKPKRTSAQEIGHGLAVMFGKPFLALMFGWILHFFV